ncbi:alpha/beta hydrolase [Arcticibacterium luteifluviistationis]|uniref:Esterase n=1 Tax=Arcticibacterium luteifluviistationis TaxID=1784714 RepID=A0A2Z4GFY2_9BACT|nr:alpha/beta hydrolase [Arcticibacterium luteifluviistationis]AWW00300.1 esterase [Arcticibacterium luteifluviistationis]
MNIISKRLISLKSLFFLSFFFLAFSSKSQNFKTLTYLENDTASLQLDLFLPQDKSVKDVPLMIFVHGGGFAVGNRTAGHSFGKYLAKNNVAYATISYTLSRKGIGFGCDTPQEDKIMAMRLAASELWEATAFLLGKADEIGFDKNKVFISGSSAGGEAVLHAAYLDRAKMSLHGNSLPSDFKYKGMISGAGAIIDLNLITKETAMPTLFFHGNKDNVVPFVTASHHYCGPERVGWMMLFGSEPIYNHLKSLDVSAQLQAFVGGKHEFAGWYFYRKQDVLLNFMNKVVAGEQFFISEEVVESAK